MAFYDVCMHGSYFFGSYVLRFPRIWSIGICDVFTYIVSFSLSLIIRFPPYTSGMMSVLVVSMISNPGRKTHCCLDCFLALFPIPLKPSEQGSLYSSNSCIFFSYYQHLWATTILWSLNPFSSIQAWEYPSSCSIFVSTCH